VTLQELRIQHPCFHYRSFAYALKGEILQLDFVFELEPDIIFQPRTFIHGLDITRFSTLRPQLLNHFIFHLGLLELLSYWKTACSPVIEIASGVLDEAQIAWWQDLFLQGLGEFFYVNQIDYTAPDFVRFKVLPHTRAYTESDSTPQCFQGSLDAKRILVPVGGGRDSIVTLEFLKKTPHELSAFLINPTQAQRDVVQISELTRQIIVERRLDSKLFDLNAAGYLNGHVPISAYYAFYACFVAVLLGYKFVSISQERSSNEGTVDFYGLSVNHQYSKTFEFEEKFRKYFTSVLASDLEYFSLLRPLYSVQISKIFANTPKYFPVFRSCNRGQKTNTWCGVCAKCLFTYASLFPFVSESVLQSIFGADILSKSELRETALELIGKRPAKPFECVGTFEENKVVFFLCMQKFQKSYADKPLPSVLGVVSAALVEETDMAQRAQALLSSWNTQHHVPEQFAELLHAFVE